MNQMVVFIINERRYGLTVSMIECVIPVVHITPVPNLPEMFLGIINLHGRIIAVFNLRQCLELPEKELILSDKLIVANTRSHSIAFLADKITDLIEYDDTQLETMDGVFSGVECVRSVVKMPDGMIFLLQDIDCFLNSGDASILQKVLHHD